jgi:S1-C subfamily serine protease
VNDDLKIFVSRPLLIPFYGDIYNRLISHGSGLIGGLYMKKRLISLVIIIILAICALPLQAFAGSLSNFSKINTYNDGQFTDVPSGQWYAKDVKTAYEYGLINGSSPTTYSPGNNMTIAEALKVSACLHSIYNTGSANFAKGIDPWYQPYIDYALTNGIITTPYPNYTTNATRSDMAVIFANALPDEAITPINKIDDNAIPDVTLSYSYGAAVYKLYRAGILTGSGDTHMFKPNDSITRAEIATIVARLASSANRVAFTIAPKDLSATEIAAQCSPAVFFIAVYDASGNPFATGSGFFINSSGLAVTNYHVIDGAYSAKIQTTDKNTYDIAGVYDYNEDYDLALVQINGSGFPYLEIGDSSTAVTGSAIFAIGSPLGFDNTLTQGIISNASRQFSDSPVSYIQVDAAISHGSSGGALLNTKGQVIGVTTAGVDDAQNINFAVPINLIKELSSSSHVPLSTVAAQKPKLSVTVTQAAVTVAQGAQATITATASSDEFDTIIWVAADKTLISCSWGDWNGNSLPLTITGLKAGTTTLYIGLLDASENILAETSVSVTVTGGGAASTGYYQEYYPVPDWGSFTGTPLYQYFTYTEGGASYYYRMSDITAPSSVGVGGYVDLLNSNGFYYYTGFTSEEGYPVNVYTNNIFDVYMAVATIGGVLCMHIMILPT